MKKTSFTIFLLLIAAGITFAQDDTSLKRVGVSSDLSVLKGIRMADAPSLELTKITASLKKDIDPLDSYVPFSNPLDPDGQSYLDGSSRDYNHEPPEPPPCTTEHSCPKGK